MPRGKWINKKTAQHFTLVHRPQNDPLIHDEAAPSMVLNPTENLNAARKSKALHDLASELGSDADFIRANEGEAATYGVYFDDTEYDYMQHLRDLGSGSGGAVFVEAKDEADKSKGKQKESLADALEGLSVDDNGAVAKRDLFDEEILPSKNLTRRTYQDMQDVPDIIGGLQPDMDPRLREVLEALEDEEYVDEDEDIFASLTKDGKELDDREFEEEEWFDDEEEDAGWETDGTEKPNNEYKISSGDEVPDLVPVLSAEEAAEAQDQVGDWMADFTKFKKDQKKPGARKLGGPPSASDLQSSILSTTTNGGRRKKRKGALTNPSAYSMTSSSLVRTEQMGILDARFDNLEQKVYNHDDDFGYAGSALDDDTNSMVSGVTGMTGASAMSTVTGPVRGDFDSVLDEFLGGHSTFNKKYIRKGGWKNGTEQLDEIRRELGPARIKGKPAATATGSGRKGGR
ncbi:uncharacterized protein PG986_004687 [Apiospora aurea]|uniref:Low temperature viability protein n=1 Tax=Apiospora aurea TaxID=335848 RepID=A0ABR1QNA1_9PEZI